MRDMAVGKIHFNSIQPCLCESFRLLSPIERIFQEIRTERKRQDKKWGVQNHPIGSASYKYGYLAEHFRKMCETRFENGKGTWVDILLEEVYEAAAEDAPVATRKELIQVAAVAVAMIESMDRNELSTKDSL